MIICVIGTRAQLIKMAPVLRELERRDLPFVFYLTGQHETTIDDLIAEFGIRTIPIRLARQEVAGLFTMAVWVPLTVIRLLRVWPVLPRETRTIVLTHGDTFTTVIAALVGRLKGARVAHVEAGLRSFNLLHPFPEELTRLAVFRLSDVSFCPNDWAARNMAGHATDVVNTQGNTLIDALGFACSKDSGVRAAAEPYGIVSIHRFENIFNRKRLRKLVDLLEMASEKARLIFVLHPATRNKLARHGLLDILRQMNGVSLVDRMGYVRFVALLRSAHFVITDGGSNQEELSYLGVPAFLMRRKTERPEGLGENIVLGDYSEAALRRFLAELAVLKKPASPRAGSPSAVVADYLVEHGYA